MNLIGVQLITIPFAILMIYVAFIHFKKNNLLKESFFFWLSLWSAFIVIASFPQLLDPIVKQFRFLRVLDLLMVIAFMILAVINYYNYLSTKKLERQLEKLIQKMITIKRPKKN